MNPSILKLSTGIKDFAFQNSPTILTTVGALGTLATAILAVKGTINAIRILDDEGATRAEKWAYEQGEEQSGYPFTFTKKEVIAYSWKCYIPAIAVGALTITAIIGANKINLRRNAALLSLYTLAERAAKEYEEKVVETLGEKRVEEIKEDLAQERLDKNPQNAENTVYTGHGTALIYDGMSGRYFYSDLEHIRQAVNEFNKDIISEGYKSLNEFYDLLNLDHTQIGDIVGWGHDYEMLEMDYKTKIADNRQPCIVMIYTVEPKNR